MEDFVEIGCDTPIARITGCVLINNIGRLLPLEVPCSLHQGQQGDANQSVGGSSKNLFSGGQNLTVVKGMHQYSM